MRTDGTEKGPQAQAGIASPILIAGPLDSPEEELYTIQMCRH
jgi:hypothetical protein